MNRTFLSAFQREPSPFAIILGTNEIASAIAVHLCRSGWATVLLHDPLLPVTRRAMAFHDALFDDRTMVEEIRGERADTAREIASIVGKPKCVAVTWLGFTDLLAFGSPLVLVDARLQKTEVTPNLRNLAAITVGLGPNFSVGSDCDIAVDTQSERCGAAIEAGPARAPAGRSRLAGDAAAARFVHADRNGLWHTPIEIGTRVFKGVVLGHLDELPVESPTDGIVRGIVRDGLDVPAGVELLEIDRYARRGSWTGMDERGCRIADATVKAIRVKVLERVAAIVSRTTLQH
jgi:xanthine dehydrogenase accessory factor